jgi:hypothetical protein
MTAADDWTKELETKGFPDLKNLYTMLGVPDRVEAHFNIKFPHNYNAVSRAQMYAFYNKYFKLGLDRIEERDFQLLSPKELSVWDDQHPKPEGGKVGEPHEVAVLGWFKAQAAKRIQPLLHPKSKTELGEAREVLGSALEVMIGRKLPGKGESTFSTREQDNKGDLLVLRGATSCGGDSVEATFVYPKNWNHTVVLWLTLKGEESILNQSGSLGEGAQKLVNRGYAVACPKLYLLGTTRNPNVYAVAKRKVTDTYEGFAGYHYAYNPTLFAERVRDALTLIAAIRDDQQHHARHILVAGVEGAGVIAAAATALAEGAVHHLACDTEGFRFAKLNNVWDVNFVPGAEKYGDVPAILSLCAPTRTTIAAETMLSAEGVLSSFHGQRPRQICRRQQGQRN